MGNSKPYGYTILHYYWLYTESFLRFCVNNELMCLYRFWDLNFCAVFSVGLWITGLHPWIKIFRNHSVQHRDWMFNTETEVLEMLVIILLIAM